MKIGKNFLMIFIFSILFPIFCAADTTLNDFLEQLKTSVKEKGGDEAEFKIGFITSAMELLKKIEAQFKDGVISYNPDVRFKFMRMVEEFEYLDVDDVLPHDIRRISARIVKFDNFLNRYCSSRDRYLSAADKAFFTQLRSLCQMLIICIDDETNFDISLMDTFCDYGYHMPMEWIKKHPYISTGVAAAVVASVVYFTCFYDSKKGFLSSLREPGLTHEYKASGTGYEVVQPAQLAQGWDLRCGYHAMWRFCCRARADLKKQSEEEMLKTLNDRTAFNSFYQECQRIEASKKHLDGTFNEALCGEILDRHSAFCGFDKAQLKNQLVIINQSNMLYEKAAEAETIARRFQQQVQEGRAYFLVNLGKQVDPLAELDYSDEMEAKIVCLPEAAQDILKRHGRQDSEKKAQTLAAQAKTVIDSDATIQPEGEYKTVDAMKQHYKTLVDQAENLMKSRIRKLQEADCHISHWIYYDFDLSNPATVKIWAGDSLGGNRTQDKVLSDIWTKVIKPVADAGKQ